VGVSTDEVVKSYKNKTPIISFKERMEIVKSVRFVDEAVPQYSMDKFSAWEKYRFNVIFHGDDWKGSKMYEEIEKKFKDVGVELVFFPHTEGTSSTKLRDVLDRFTNK
jgi:glycerol-3-phosphate cytidylyltransferase